MNGHERGPRPGDLPGVAVKQSPDDAPVSGLAARLADMAPDRLGTGLATLVDALHLLVRELKVTPAEFRHLLDYLTTVGHYADARRQEWVLLADALGLSALIEEMNSPRPPGCTPNTVAGPFYRTDAPDRAYGASLSLDGRGTPLAVTGRVLSLGGAPVAGALIEVWQANGLGKYENQEPDLQPENNLRGRLRSDDLGRFAFRSVMPAGYALPSDGPVGALMRRLGLGLDRPAHIHFRVSAPGHERLTTHIFDRDDPAIGRDAVFGVKPELLAEFRSLPPTGGEGGRALALDLVLCPLRQS